MMAGNQNPHVLIAHPIDCSTQHHFKGLVAIGLGIPQIIFGAIIIIIQVADRIYGSYFSFSLTGIWTGLFFIAYGVIGILAGKKKTWRMVITYLVMSLICALVGAGLFVYGIIAMCLMQMTNLNRNQRDKNFANAMLLVIMGICGLAELIFAIISSAFCCHGLCSCCQKKQTMQVVYMKQDQNP